MAAVEWEFIKSFFAGKIESLSGKWVLGYAGGTLAVALIAACMAFGAIAGA